MGAIFGGLFIAFFLVSLICYLRLQDLSDNNKQWYGYSD